MKTSAGFILADLNQGESARFRYPNRRYLRWQDRALMSYKDLLVVLDATAPARGRIDLAAALAERFAAHLVGLYPLPIPRAPRELGYFDSRDAGSVLRGGAGTGARCRRQGAGAVRGRRQTARRIGGMASGPRGRGGGSGAPRPLCRSDHSRPT